MNTFNLRHQKLNLIVNPNHLGYGKGTIFFDNDDIDTLENKKYIRVELEFKDKILKVKINFNDTKYIYRDDILHTIEIWRINELYKENTLNKKNIKMKMKVKDKYMTINGEIDKVNNKIKIVFKDAVSLFDLYEIDMND
jgi:hypothetical protein